MAMSHQRTPRLKPLLDRIPPGFMVETRWIREQGVDSKSIHRYVAKGWLKPFVRGVYQRPVPAKGDLGGLGNWYIPVLSLQRIMGYQVHVGGPTALHEQGLAHYLGFGEDQVFVYGDVPSWLNRLPKTWQLEQRSLRLFNDGSTAVKSARGRENYLNCDVPMVDVWRWPMTMSEPERAILEAIDELPNRLGFEYVDTLFESLVNLRPELLSKLLAECTSIKVKRLFLVFADRHGHSWLSHLNKDQIDLGSGPRALVDGGKLHPTYRIYVPSEFVTAATVRHA